MAAWVAARARSMQSPDGPPIAGLTRRPPSLGWDGTAGSLDLLRHELRQRSHAHAEVALDIDAAVEPSEKASSGRLASRSTRATPGWSGRAKTASRAAIPSGRCDTRYSRLAVRAQSEGEGAHGDAAGAEQPQPRPTERAGRATTRTFMPKASPAGPHVSVPCDPRRESEERGLAILRTVPPPGRHDVCPRTRYRRSSSPLHQGAVPRGVRALGLVRPPRRALAHDRPRGPAARQRHRVAPARARLARRRLHDRSRHARTAASSRTRRRSPSRPRRRALAACRPRGRATSTRSSSAPAPAISVPASPATSIERLGLRADVAGASTSSARAAARRLPNLRSADALLASGARDPACCRSASR